MTITRYCRILLSVSLITFRCAQYKLHRSIRGSSEYPALTCKSSTPLRLTPDKLLRNKVNSHPYQT